MNRFAYPLLLLLFVPSLPAQQKKAADSEPPPIILPADPIPPKPPEPPKPDPPPPAQLGADMIYVVRGSVDAVVITSPAGVIKVTKEAGPVKIRAKFYGNGDKWETKTFAEKYIWTIETLSKGQAELIIVPNGGADKDIIRRQIEALDGPNPPPVPPGPPITISIEPMKATVPISGKQQFTATVSQGGVKWVAIGAGVVDQTGLFTAGGVGSVNVVASSMLDPSKTVTALVTVTDRPPDP